MKSYLKSNSITGQDKKWIVMMNEPWRVKWDLFVILLAFWNSISVPFDLAFRPKILQHPLLRALNWIIDALFVIDIVINFRTSFISPQTGEEVTNAKEIAASYLKGRFWIDLAAVINIELILDHNHNHDIIFDESAATTFLESL